MKDDKTRVVRGGSWISPRDFARAVYRFHGHPHYRDDLIGFRVVCGSPILNTDPLNTEEKIMRIEDINWITIPGGEILFRDKQIEVQEFQLMETLVTNGMWEQFLADDYDNPKWWIDAPEGADHHNIPGRWSEPDCPRETVNWYQANAFARWLSANLGAECDLPSEEQWYFAATGGNPENAYPWGKTFDKNKCNVFESDIERTTPVTKYPDGRTEQGVLDMTGNLWEWTRTPYE